MIEVTLGEEKKEKGYPKLMIHCDGEISLFTEYGECTVIKAACDGAKRCIGHRPPNTCMDSFTDYNESITLKNGG